MALEKAIEERIIELAHKIYLERVANNIQGDSNSDWEKAKNMIMNNDEVGTDANTWAR